MPNPEGTVVNIRRYPVTNSAWVTVLAPMIGNTFSLREASGKSFIVSSTPDNASAQDTIAVNASFDFLITRNLGEKFRFRLGDLLVYVQAVDGSGATVVGYFGS